jgi:type I restriction enzyme S subunit
MRPYLRVANVFEDEIRLDSVMEMHFDDADLRRFELRPGDILLNEGQSPQFLGRPAIYRGELPGACFTNSLIRFQVSEAIEARFALLLFRHWMWSGEFQKLSQITTNIAHLSAGRFADMEFPVAPLPEQRRIVEKVDALLEQVNRAKERLDRVPLILKRFRQAVLAAACSGELTPSLNADAWETRVLGDVIEGFEAGRNLKSQGRAAGPGDYGVLKISAVTWGSFRPEENKALLAGDEPRPHERIRAGDLLITRANTYDLVGAVVLVARDYLNLMLPDKILRLRLKKNLVDARFLVHALRSQAVREHFENEATGTSDSMRNLSQPKMAAAPLILPPLREQSQVADAIESLLLIADTIERRVHAAAARADRLPQAILSKAFSGELVPTEADLARAEGREYETAEQLLMRVRGQTENGRGVGIRGARRPRGGLGRDGGMG